MIERVRAFVAECALLEEKLRDPELYRRSQELIRVQKRLKELTPVKRLLEEYDRCVRAIAVAEDVRGDVELAAIAEEEADAARRKLPGIEEQFRRFLVPKDSTDERGVILEVRAGTGGGEAGLFAAELLRMYLRFAETQGWKTQLLNKSDADGGGVKEATCNIDGLGVYGFLKFESGVHRVQRIPATESKGRVHTSTATVAILPEAEEIDVTIRPEDLRIDTYRASGAGGQHVNKTESAVRVTHVPTGTVVACQSERSQQQNREVALSLLRSRLYAALQERLATERGELRSVQIGSGDRSEKIRTYNFPQDRVTDHRLERNFSNLPSIMEGGMGEIIEALREKDEEERLTKIDREGKR